MITFQPKRGQVLMCDFTFLEVPEMVKRRPVVIVSPRLARDPRLVTIVPLSTMQSDLPYHPLLDPDSLPPPLKQKPAWAKCDMLYTLSTARLDRVRGKQRKGNPAQWYGKWSVTEKDMRRIHDGVLAAFGAPGHQA